MFNFKQFKQKKKRVVDPNAPPRPNLLTHEKKLKESQAAFDELQRLVYTQQQEIDSLRSKMRDMQSSMEMLIGYVRRNK